MLAGAGARLQTAEGAGWRRRWSIWACRARAQRIDLIAEWRAADPARCRFVIFTEARRPSFRFALCAGATGYVLKERDDLEVSISIRSVLRGGAPIDPFIARRIIAELQPPGTAPTPSGSKIRWKNAGRARTADPAPYGRRHEQPRDRRCAVPVAPHGGMPCEARVPQAGGQFARKRRRQRRRLRLGCWGDDRAWAWRRNGAVIGRPSVGGAAGAVPPSLTRTSKFASSACLTGADSSSFTVNRLLGHFGRTSVLLMRSGGHPLARWPVAGAGTCPPCAGCCCAPWPA